MRSHGFPTFPDPTVSGCGIQMQMGQNSGIDPNARRFQAAQTACQPVLSSGPQAGRATKGGNG